MLGMALGRVGANGLCPTGKKHSKCVESSKVSKNLGCSRFLFAGSQAEYGVTTRQRIEGHCDESILCRPISAYGKAKKRS